MYSYTAIAIVHACMLAIYNYTKPVKPHNIAILVHYIFL